MLTFTRYPAITLLPRITPAEVPKGEVQRMSVGAPHSPSTGLFGQRASVVSKTTAFCGLGGGLEQPS